MISLKRIVEAKYDYGCVMARIDEAAARLVFEFNNQFISEEVIYQEESGDYGREKEPHVTIKFGLVESYNEQQMRQLLRNVVPFDIEVGGVTIFEGDNPYDVVKFDVKSPVLEQLHERFSLLPNHDEHPIYHPHMTLAYVKKGHGNKFVRLPNKHAKVKVNMIEYSDRGIKSYYQL